MISQNLQQFGYLTQGLDEIMPLQWNYLRFSLTWSGLTEAANITPLIMLEFFKIRFEK